MKNYFYLLVLLCSIKTIAQPTDCAQPKYDSENITVDEYNYYNYYGWTGGNFFANNTITVSNIHAYNSKYIAANSIILGQDFRGQPFFPTEHEIKASIQNCNLCSCIDNLGLAILPDPYYEDFKRYEILTANPQCNLNEITFDWYYNGQILEDSGIWLTLLYSDYPDIKLVVKLANGCTNAFYFNESDPNLPSEWFDNATQWAINQGYLTKTEELIVSPNPSFGVFNVSGQFKKGMKMVVTNQFNIQVLKSVAKYDNQENIDLTGFPPGIYIVKFLGVNAIYTGKLIKG